MATLDTTTTAEYTALYNAADRAALIVSALSGTVTVNVYNGSNVVVGTGTMSTPWASVSGNTVVVGSVVGFAVTTTGTPDANWYLRFVSGSRYVQFSFGLLGSGKEAIWSRNDWIAGTQAGIRNSVITVSGNVAPVFTVTQTNASLPSTGGTIQFTAVDPDGDTVVYSLTTTRSGITINASTGLVTVTSAAAGSSGNITVRASDGTLTADATCAVTVSIPEGTILWDGSFPSGDYNAYPWAVPGQILFYGIPEGRGPDGTTRTAGGRPIRYSTEQTSSLHVGDGSLAGIVHRTGATVAKSFGNVVYPQGPVRRGDYAGRYTIRNSVNGSEPADCGESNNRNCTYRRTETWTWGGGDDNYMAEYLNAWPQFATRWLSHSVYLPSDFELAGSSTDIDFVPIVLQVKCRQQGQAVSPGIALAIRPGTGGWMLTHRTHPEIAYKLCQPGLTIQPPAEYYYDFRHDSVYTATLGTGVAGDDDHLIVDYPNAAASRAALADVTKSEWHDFIFQIKADPRGPNEGGTGFLRMWKRRGSGAWVQVLDITPREFDVSGYTFKRGVLWNDPGSNDSNNANRSLIPADWTSTLVNQSGTFYSNGNGGFCVMCGMYGKKVYFWNAPRNVTIYVDNTRLGDEFASLTTMSPEAA